jgi:hypothetical protein
MLKCASFVRALLVTALALVLGAVATSQEESLVRVNALVLSPHQTLIVDGVGLDEGDTVTLVLESPSGEVRRSEQQADETGRVRFETALDEAGSWLLTFTAETLQEQLTLTVREEIDDGAARDEGEPDEREVDEEVVAALEETAAALPTDVRFENGDLLAERDGELLWSLPFPPGSGPSGPALITDEGIYAAHGNSVLRLEPASGQVEARWLVSGPVQALRQEAEALLISVDRGGGLLERFTVVGGKVQETVRFAPEPELYGWLRAEADVEDPAARLERDPTNPWLYLGVSALDLEDDPLTAREQLREGVRRAQSFYDLAGLSRALVTIGQLELASEAFDAAMVDFAARGYHPELLRDPELEAAYHFPLTPLRRAIEAGDLAQAAFWAERVVLASPRVPGARAALDAYADRLAAAGQPEAAAFWRGELDELARPADTGGLEQLFLTLGRHGWAAVLALLATIFLLHLTLVAKYWVPQSEARAPVWGRLLSIRYYSLTEKLVLVLLLAITLGAAGLAAWYERGEGMPRASYAGSFALPEVRSQLAAAELRGPRAEFIHGYAAHVAQEREEARRRYLAAGDYAPALNNLGALEGDELRFQRALALQRGMPEARYNLGRISGGFPFEQRYLPGQPVLALPKPGDFHLASAGSWDAALARVYTNPWNALRDAAPWGLPSWLWQALLILFFAVAAVTVVWLFIPRPRRARRARRTPLYHLLAFLIPGSGLADEAWGFLLLIPWALVSLHLASLQLGWEVDLGLGHTVALVVMGVLYLVNTAAFIVEYLGYRRAVQKGYQ